MAAMIREITAGDKQHVHRLIQKIMEKEFAADVAAYSYDDLDALEDHYGGDRDLFLVAEKDGKIVGTVAIKEDGSDCALLRRIFVHKDYRGKGYGSKLLSKAMEFCFEHDYHTVAFRGAARMQTALQLCLRNGFEQTDISELGDIQLVVLTKDI